MLNETQIQSIHKFIKSSDVKYIDVQHELIDTLTSH